MPKTKISEFSATPGNNTDIDGINIAEGCAPSGINDAIRELMAQLKDFQAGTAGDSFNGPVGTSTAAAGAFTTLSATGVATFSSGTAGAPAITTTGDTNTGIFFPAADTVAASVGGTEGLRLTSTGLGVGTSTPATKLHVEVSGASSVITNKGTSSNYYGYAGSTLVTQLLSSSTQTYLNSVANVPIIFGTNDTERMRLDSSGNLGLGVTPSAWSAGKAFEMSAVGNGVWCSPDTYLIRNCYYNGGWKYASTAAAANYYIDSTGQHIWSRAPSGTAGNTISFTQAMTLDADGDLGIGTTSPGFKLDVQGTTPAIRLKTAGVADGFKIEQSNATGDVELNVINGYPLIFKTTNTERARITSGGDLLVGTTSAILTTAGAFIASYGSIASITATADYSIFNKTTNSTGKQIEFRSANTAVGYIESTSTATSYNTSSDYRLKDNPQPLTGSGAFIDALKPKTWDWKSGGKGVGFIAHEVQEVSPSTVSGSKDAVDEEGKPIMQAMEYGSAEFIANIIAELQSLRARVAALESNP